MTEPFHNIQIDIDQLPKQAHIDFSPLERNYMFVHLITVLLFWSLAFLLVIFSPIIFEFELPGILKTTLPIAIVILAIVSFVLSYFGFRKKGYAIRDKDILYKRGLVWRSVTTIPFSRVQHCEVKEGPIERIFGLSSLHIYTAGGSSSDIDIPGLLPSRAQDVKSFVLQKLIKDEEE